MVFIDGLHLYDQVRRDVANALAVVPAGGWIALHDMFPRDWIEEHTPQISTSRWTGDPWKVGFEPHPDRGRTSSVCCRSTTASASSVC